MTPERFRQVAELFQAALERPAADRLAFVRHASDADDELRAEVSAMLEAHHAVDAGDVPALAHATDDLELIPGAALGPYTIQALIGAGGMGRVYRARDARLDRDVAVKVLPAAYAEDSGRLKRFEQEARASGALTHPNVLTVYDVGTDNGRPYLVTELLDGDTLRERVTRGALPAARACEIAAALARGLAAAHGKGVVHRDLKPENVMVTRDGRIKILDFGVAKLRAGEGRSAAAPATSTVQTEAGVIVGTVGYMAPEQVRGHDPDGRADIFALGTILFELLTGRRAFERPSRAATLDATLIDDPLSSERGATDWPPAVHRIVQRCLEKDPEARFQSAADLGFALETVTGTSATPHDQGPHRGRRAWIAAAAAVALLATVIAVLAGLWRTPPAPAAGDPIVRFPLPIGARIRFSGLPAVSPDGKHVVYPATEGPMESQRLYVRSLDQVAAVTLPGTERGASPFFSPDGTSIAFWDGTMLKRTRLDGTAAPVTICKVESFLGGAWTADGTIVFASNDNALQEVDAGGGVPRPVTGLVRAQSEIDHHAPAMLPGGRAMLLTVHEGDARFRVDVVRLQTGARHTVVEAGFDARYLPTGHIVYAVGSALFAAPFDLASLSRSGSPVQLIDNVWTNQREGIGNYGLSETGTLVYLPGSAPAQRTLAWVDRAGRITPLPLDRRAYSTPRLSPDGRQFAVVVRDEHATEIWIHHFERATFRRLASAGRNWSPVWSADSSQLVHTSERDGRWHLVRETLDGSAEADVLLTSDEEVTPGAVSADGRSVFYSTRAANGSTTLRVLDVERRHSTDIDGLPGRVAMPVLSPDGRWLGFTGWRTPRPALFVRRVGATAPVRELLDLAGYTVWSRAGDKIYFRSRRGASEASPVDGVFEMPFDGVRGEATGPPKELFRMAFVDWAGVPGFDVASDGRFLLVLPDERESLARDPEVVLHVDDELRRRTLPLAR